MSKKPQRTQALAKHEFTSAANAPEGQLTYGQAMSRDVPVLSAVNLNPVFIRLRDFGSKSQFLTSYLPLQHSFYNYGFRIGLGSGATQTQEVLDKWLATPIETKIPYTDPQSKQTIEIQINQTNWEAISKLVSDIWYEYLLLDNVVTLWFEKDSLPTTILPERCTYTDKFGLPLLKYEHNLSPAEIELLAPDQQELFRKNRLILLDAGQGQYFKVLKRGPVGSGFGVPRLYSLLMTMSEVAQKEFGMHAQSYNLMAAPRMHKLGHEITAGNHAGKPNWFINKKRADKVLSIFDKRTGPFDMPVNFDHEILFPWPNMEYFDEMAFKGSDRRFRNFGGPIAQMLISDKIVEGGLQFLRAQATEERDNLRRYATQIIRQSFAAPEGCDVQMVWSDLIFNDPKQAAELLKFAAQYGLVSKKTAQQQIGYDPGVEGLQQVSEADDTNEVKKRPWWDAAHGFAPAQGDTSITAAAAAPAAGTGPDPQKKIGKPSGASNKTAI